MSSLKLKISAVFTAIAAAFSVSGFNPYSTNISAFAEQQSAVSDVSENIGLVGNLFCVKGSDSADHAALQWATTLSAKSYTLYRSSDKNTGYVPIYTGGGNSFEDDNMSIGNTYYYQLKVSGDKGDSYSDICELSPCEIPSGLSTYDNQKGSNLVYETNGTKVGNTYYSYSLKSHGNGDIYLAETSSSDGKHFGNERNVADSSQNSALASCKIESVHIEYVPSANKIVVWAHWEKPSGYSDGKALVITGTPGGQFTVHHVYNPLGIQVRDMAIFFDDDNTGYLIAAANKEGQGANATIYIFRMNDDYSDVTEVVKTLHENQYREFPNLIKRNGYYFLFTSQAAGWYPSSGAYTVTDNLYGDWSELRSIGNTSTFSSQSGWIVNLQDKNYLMHAYRWLRASSTSGTTLCPLYFDNGFAFYDYYPSFRYSTKTGELYPVHEGQLLSQDKTATASIASEKKYSASKAVDGSYQSSFTAIGDYKKWPFYIQIDLENICELANIQTSWYICKGSEGYYTYTVEGSTDGVNWTKLLDHTDKSSDIVNSTYGFNSDMLSGKARYVRLNVKNATLQNNPNNNWYTPTVYEVKVFGTPLEKGTAPKPCVSYDFEKETGGAVNDVLGSSDSLKLNGSAKIVNDSEKGNVLYLDGDGFAEITGGLLDGCSDYTIMFDAKSESDGDFFTMSLGQDRNKYVLIRTAVDHVRFATTTDTWRGESGFRHDLDGTKWHSYILTVNGASGRLYADGELVCESTELTTLLSEMGTDTKVLVGKSVYEEDKLFTGYMDNLTIYKTALNPKEIGVSDTAEGDINGDGVFSIADAVALQKWLIASGEIKNPQKADMNSDGIIDVLDLCELKMMVLKVGN
ncbi:MAG: discoidin domain-containing protein [Ruminococcus sp.]|nr:discoidin domain-containing protein [Ruminococcus sp.]